MISNARASLFTQPPIPRKKQVQFPSIELHHWRQRLQSDSTEELKSAINEFTKNRDVNFVMKNHCHMPVASLLYLAAQYGRLKIVKYLVEKKEADVNLLNHHGRDKAINIAASMAHFDCASYLLSNGSIVSNASVLYDAINNSHKQFADCLVKQPVPIDKQKQKEFIISLFKHGDSIENASNKKQLSKRQRQQLEEFKDVFDRQDKSKGFVLQSDNFSDVMFEFQTLQPSF